MIIQNLRYKHGYVLPVVVLSVLILSVLGYMLVMRFTGPGAQEFNRTKSDNPQYETAFAGISRARYELTRPDDRAQAHIWNQGDKKTFKIEIDGNEAKVTIEDTYLNNPAISSDNQFKGVFGSKTTSGGLPVNTVSVDVGDYDGDGLHIATEQLPTDGHRKVFYLRHKPIQTLLMVRVDGHILAQQNPTTKVSNYCFDIKNGWISFRNTYDTREDVIVTYQWSEDLDVAVANGGASQPQENIFYNNNGNFVFSESTIPGPVEMTQDIAFCDFDRDGDLDVASANWIGGLKIHHNDGMGNFMRHTVLGGVGENSTAIAWGDCDGDGMMDIVVANAGNNKNRLFKYYGLDLLLNPVFKEVWSNEETGPTRAVDFGDFDNDGDLDILFGDNVGRLVLWENRIAAVHFIYVADAFNHQITRRRADTLAFVDSFGSFGSGVNQFNQPSGIAVDDDFIYVADSRNHRIMKLNKNDYSFVNMIGSRGIGNDQFDEPQGLAVDGRFLYICDTGNHRIQKRDKTDLSFVSKVGIIGDESHNDQFDRPQAIQVDSKYIYVTMRADAVPSTPRIQKRNKGNLSFDSTVIGAGFGNDQFNIPFGIAREGSRIYVVEQGNCRINKRRTSNLSFDNILFGSLGSGNDNFYAPTGATAYGGYLYICDAGNSRIMKLNSRSSSLTYDSEVGVNPADLRSIAYDENRNGEPEWKFIKAWTSAQDLPFEDVQWADIDNDGDLDIVAVTGSNGYIVFGNDGGGVFTPKWQNFGNTAKGVAVGDIDKDNNLDLVFSHQVNTARVNCFLNYGGGLFNYEWGSDEDTQNYNDFQSNKLCLADFNNDGKLDIVASADSSLSASSDPYAGIVVYKNSEKIKAVKLTSTSKSRNGTTTIVMYYAVTDSGKIGNILSAEVK